MLHGIRHLISLFQLFRFYFHFIPIRNRKLHARTLVLHLLHLFKLKDLPFQLLNYTTIYSKIEWWSRHRKHPIYTKLFPTAMPINVFEYNNNYVIYHNSLAFLPISLPSLLCCYWSNQWSVDHWSRKPCQFNKSHRYEGKRRKFSLWQYEYVFKTVLANSMST